jgi:hypothetical protein
VTPDPVFDLQLTTLQLSEVRRLERTYQSELLPRGAKLVRGGVGMEPGGDLSGWVAYANSESDLQLPSWPEWTVPARLDDVLPASVEVVGVYHGGEWRRAAERSTPGSRTSPATAAGSPPTWSSGPG